MLHFNPFTKKSRKPHSLKKSRTAKRKSSRGGANPVIDYASSSYSSGPTYEMATVGTQNEQYDRTFNMGSTTPGNALTNISGTAHVGGKSGRKKRHRKHKKGGSLSRLAVPFGLLLSQQYISRKKSRKGKKSKKSSRRSRRR